LNAETSDFLFNPRDLKASFTFYYFPLNHCTVNIIKQFRSMESTSVFTCLLIVTALEEFSVQPLPLQCANANIGGTQRQFHT
jgi:hypothetical protein